MAGRKIHLFLALIGCLFVIGQSYVVPYVDNDSISENRTPKKPFTLEEAYYGLFTPSKFHGSWMSDNEILSWNVLLARATKYNVETGKKTIIFDKLWTLPSKYRFASAEFSPNGEYVLYIYNGTRIYRRSSTTNIAVYNVKHSTFEELAKDARVTLAKWSPIGSELIYVQDNDIYHAVFKAGKNALRRVTKSGKPGIVFNGIPDWVYEEEALVSSSAIWCSPDGRYLAFASFNDTQVKDIEYSRYGTPGSFKDQYPTLVKIKYPKPGTPNPVVSLSVIDLSDSSSEAVALKAPIDVVSSHHILYTVSWWDSTHIAATWTNRVQNQSQLVIYDTQGTSKLTLYNEERKGWLQLSSPIKYGNYTLLLRQEDSGTSAGEFQHVVRYEHGSGQFTSRVDLTPGPSEVLNPIRAVIANKVYYIATAPGKPEQSNLYSVPLDASQKPTCISCEHLTPEGNRCTYATVSFSSRGSYYILTCNGPDPTTVTIYDAHHRPVKDLEKNEILRSALSQRLTPLQVDFNVTVNGYDSKVRLLLPPDFNETKTYPMLVKVYGAPYYVTITDLFKIDLQHYMTTNKNVIYAWIDGRGSGYKGSKMLFEIYRRMGVVEVEDTIAVTKILQQRYSWIDPNRTGIWGWSYGGFFTGMVLATDTESVFKCGISVAPVTSWMYYDSIYTERYMGLPTEDDDLAGYRRTDISERVKGIRGKKYMLIHGSGDDNVHYQQTMLLAKSLERHDILFDQVTYTDEQHSLSYVRPHLYHRMDKFWNECFA